MQVKSVQPRKAANVTPAIIEEWKKAFPRGIWEMKVFPEDDGEPKIGYFRKPTRQELGAASTIQNDPLAIAEDLLRTSWLGGDEELLEDDDYFQGALEQYQELMKVRKGEIKKL
jgi:hypothetical protein